MDILCHKCGHSIDEHYHGCLNVDAGYICECLLEVSDIAAYAIEQVKGDIAKELIKLINGEVNNVRVDKDRNS